MALPTFSSARDEILGLFHAKWTADTPAINGSSVISVEWPRVDSKDPPSANEPYARISIRHTGSSHRAFGKVGERKFTRRGLVTVQVFWPISDGGGLSFAENAAIIARDAYEGVGTDSGIWFRNVYIREIGPTKAWYQINVVAEFEYDELI